MAKKPKESKKAEAPLTHGERQNKSIEDVKFTFILLAVLLLITGGWNIYNQVKINELTQLNKTFDTVQEEIREKCLDPRFLKKAKSIRERKAADDEFVSNVMNTIKNVATMKSNKWEPYTKGRGDKSTEEYYFTPSIESITFKDLVSALDNIQQNSLDIWCTEIRNLKPIINAETGFATTKPPTYTVDQMRFSRFKSK